MVQQEPMEMPIGAPGGAWAEPLAPVNAEVAKPEDASVTVQSKRSEKKSASKTKDARRQRRNQVNQGANTWLYSPTMYKRRFCAYFPSVDLCKRGVQCAFAHCRDEFRGPLLTAQEETEPTHSDEFYIEKYKTLWCPIGVQHDWQTCVYAHNYMDVRRDPEIGYGPRQCPHWDKRNCMTEYTERCPNGTSCPYAHGAKEQLYHPSYFKVVVCWDMMTKQGCPRGTLCAFHHTDAQARVAQTEYDYAKPLSQEQMAKIQPDFTTPPPIGTEDVGPKKDKKSGDKQRPMNNKMNNNQEFIPYAHMQPQVPMMLCPMPPMMPYPHDAARPADPGSPKDGSPNGALRPGMPPHGPQQPMMMVPMMMYPNMHGQNMSGPNMSGPNMPGPNMPGQNSPQEQSPQNRYEGQNRFEGSPHSQPNMPGFGSPMGMMMMPMPMNHDGGFPMCMPGGFNLNTTANPWGTPMNAPTTPMTPMTPMDRYTQDILNADGDCFDLDFEKFAGRLSDVSTDEGYTQDTAEVSSSN